MIHHQSAAFFLVLLLSISFFQFLNFKYVLLRCHLPTGKTQWLCEKHQNGPRITKLSTESASRDEVRRVLFEEDVQFRELIEKSPIYKKKRAMVSQKKSVNLPTKGMFLISLNKIFNAVTLNYF